MRFMRTMTVLSTCGALAFGVRETLLHHHDVGVRVLVVLQTELEGALRTAVDAVPEASGEAIARLDLKLDEAAKPLLVDYA